MLPDQFKSKIPKIKFVYLLEKLILIWNQKAGTNKKNNDLLWFIVLEII